MKRLCTDSNTYPINITAAASAATDSAAVVSAAEIFTDNHQLLDNNLRYNSTALQLADAYDVIPDPTRIQPDPKPNNDGASIETPRRPRGRPIGSKNKPKSPNRNPTRLPTRPEPNNLINVNQPNHNNFFNNQILEIPNGADVIESIAKHAVFHNTSLRVVHITGSVAKVAVRQFNHHLQQVVNFGGRYNVVSLHAVFINPTSSGLTQSQQQSVIRAFNDVAIMLSVQKGEIGGGILVGPLIACGSVFVLVEQILNLTYQLLEEDVSEINVNTTSSGGGHHLDQSPPCDMVLNGGMYSSASLMPY